MPRGRRPLDAETKAKNRQDTLRRYAAKNRETLRLAARTRMQAVRAFNSEIVVSEGCTPKHSLRARASDAKYRERQYLEKHGTETLDEQMQRRHLTKTQKRHEGRPPTGRPTSAALLCWRAHRAMELEETTPNQRRCRTLRAMHLEEDNGDDSDEDLAEGICGCDRSECQLLHRNETQKRRDWKAFHLKYDDDARYRALVPRARALNSSCSSIGSSLRRRRNLKGGCCSSGLERRRGMDVPGHTRPRFSPLLFLFQEPGGWGFSGRSTGWERGGYISWYWVIIGEEFSDIEVEQKGRRGPACGRG
ncbi:hypothetical protein C8F04DRAFT_1179494 [Mycena alexandri]|uniref:Uncharacterized protein n=1 Tax=Mycena alexandri TaxID=1745969 RepID=A0AAD6X8I9_9AGAR|nr:hypothetical protein C8F04DRAFT_1179494 [Mycena alexandri]